ncbi:DUF1003 domain-containing protein [Asanoa sp. NPDC049573]|uniref:DUF1003 domain-containing protein n=1 Tax=Asanoa sp. NPDC049573 TaxID=3155396 RepID=UPI00342E1576
MTRKPLWHKHPAVRSGGQLTRGERAADRLRSVMGSWAFVFGALLFLAGWMTGNGSHGFDPYPFILLNLVLSCLAALQGAILLIAGRRADQISSELALHDYEADKHSQETVDAIYQLTAEIHRAACPSAIDPADPDRPASTRHATA